MESSIDLSKVFVKDAVVLDHEPFLNKDTMFDFMVDRFVQAGIVTDKLEYLDALQYREGLGSTYMGNYIALPHGKCDAVTQPGIGFCRCVSPFQYESCGESGEVKYIFMLAIAGTQTGDEYMRVLAALAGLLAHDEFIDLVSKAKSYNEILEIIKEFKK